MNITYTGKQEVLHPAHEAQLKVKLEKLGKLLEGNGKGDKQVHVILEHEKNHHKAEITLNYLDHTLVGQHLDPEQHTAINGALDKLEKQLVRVRDKRRDVKKGPREGWDKSASANTVTAAEPSSPDGVQAATNDKPRVFRVEPSESKPMTSEEALLEIGSADDYFVYRNAHNDRLAVLLRRPDGNFDLVEC